LNAPNRNFSFIKIETALVAAFLSKRNRKHNGLPDAARAP
jgi:hypothetical protein